MHICVQQYQVLFYQMSGHGTKKRDKFPYHAQNFIELLQTLLSYVDDQHPSHDLMSHNKQSTVLE